MNTSYLRESDRIFLMQAMRLCKSIDPYIKTLGLNPKEVAAFKQDIQSALFIAGRYRSFANSFFLCNSDTMRKRLAELVYQCLQSVNYNQNIGSALGIDDYAKFSATIFYWPGFGINSDN
jgi:hypothetical protein